MKITAIETIPVSVPLKPQFAIKSGRGGSHTKSPFLLVKVHTDAGITGLGEASCTPRWSGEDQFTAQHLINTYFAPLLIGEDPTQIEACCAKYMTVVAHHPFTKSAIEMALWDIAGKAAGKPVYELLGGKVRDSVKTKWSVSGKPPEQAAEIARWAIDQGFEKMKVKVGIDPQSDIERVQAVRVAVGTKSHLGADANGGWSTQEIALSTINRLLEESIYFIEQPLPQCDIAGAIELRKHLKIPLVADESVYSVEDAINLHKLGAADVFSIYVGKAGGLGPARGIARFAESVNLSCTIGSNLEMGIGSAAMTHLGLASRAIDSDRFPCDIIGPFFYEDDVVLKEPLALKPGDARATDKPGLGVELDDAKVEKYRVK